MPPAAAGMRGRRSWHARCPGSPAMRSMHGRHGSMARTHNDGLGLGRRLLLALLSVLPLLALQGQHSRCELVRGKGGCAGQRYQSV